MIKVVIFRTPLRERMKELLEYGYKRYKLAFVGKLPADEFKHYFDLFLPELNYNALEKELGITKSEIVIVGSKNVNGPLKTIVYKSPEQVRNDLIRLDSENQFLRPKTFRCTQCGECCRPIVKVIESDIIRIEKIGHRRQDFLAYDPIENNHQKKDTLKQINGICLFLKREEHKFYCGIYEQRPQNCRIYPFVKNNLKLKECVPQYLTPQRPLSKIMKQE